MPLAISIFTQTLAPSSPRSCKPCTACGMRSCCRSISLRSWQPCMDILVHTSHPANNALCPLPVPLQSHRPKLRVPSVRHITRIQSLAILSHLLLRLRACLWTLDLNIILSRSWMLLQSVPYQPQGHCYCHHIGKSSSSFVNNPICAYVINRNLVESIIQQSHPSLNPICRLSRPSQLIHCLHLDVLALLCLTSALGSAPVRSRQLGCIYGPRLSACLIWLENFDPEYHPGNSSSESVENGTRRWIFESRI